MTDEQNVIVMPLMGSNRPETTLQIGARQVDLRPRTVIDDGEVPLTARFPKDLVRAMDKLFQYEGMPYQTKSDVLRDAAYYMVEALYEKLGLSDQDIRSVLHSQRGKALSQFHTDQRNGARRATHQLREHLVTALSVEDLYEAHRVLVAYWEHIDQIPLQFWRKWYTKQFAESRTVQVTVRLLLQWGYILPQGLVDACQNPTRSSTALPPAT